jgi:hypothetical protein
MPTIAVRVGAGVGATAAVQADSSGLRGRFRLTTGSSGLAAGPLVAIALDAPLVADLDVYVGTLIAGAINATPFASPDVGITPWTPPPIGCAFQEVAQLAQGQLVGFIVAATTPLSPNTDYRFGWRVDV